MYVNGRVFPKHTGVQKLRDPYVYRNRKYKTEEEYWLAILLSQRGIHFYYELINFPGWVPDFVLHKPYQWNGTPYPGSRVWGIELKWLSPLRQEWIDRSVGLWRTYRIPILILSRADLELYFRDGNLPLETLH